MYAIVGAIVRAFVFVIAAKVAMAHELTGKEHEEMLLPTVRIYSFDGGVGSGVIVAVKEGLEDVEPTLYGAAQKRKRTTYSYIITNAHVVLSNKGPYGRGTKPEGAQFSLYGETEVRTAKLLKVDEEKDLALLRYKGGLTAGVLAPKETALKPFDEVWTVGSPAGRAIHISVGVLSNMCDDFSAGKLDCYILHSAPIYYGNSGGGLWKKTNGRYELIGITSMVFVHRGVPVSHITVAIPFNVVWEFLPDHIAPVETDVDTEKRLPFQPYRPCVRSECGNER